MQETTLVEIIAVRLSDPATRQEIIDLYRQVNNNLSEAVDIAHAPQSVELFTHTDNETDLSIYLHWSSYASQESSPVLGLSIVELLSEHGLVNHSFWISSHPS